MPPQATSKKKPGVEDWRWGAFWKGGFYGNNKTNKEARCRGEVALQEAKLKEEQTDKIRCGALQPGEALSGDKFHELGPSHTLYIWHCHLNSAQHSLP